MMQRLKVVVVKAVKADADRVVLVAVAAISTLLSSVLV